MKLNQPLSLSLHALLHMAEQPDASMTSAELAACMNTNAVVIRRTFAGLRQAGIVTSAKGHGGGWRLDRAPAAITLDQVQRALGERVVACSASDMPPECLVNRAVQNALDEAMAEAVRLLDQRLATLTLADLMADVKRLHAAIPKNRKGKRHAA
jgi:Rrf2 family protein